MGFSESLKNELEYKGILVKELAHKTGIPKKTIDNYLLTQGTMPPADKAVSIAGALGVSVEYLITGKETASKPTQSRLHSPELRTIAELVEQLPREKRKLIENTVVELVELISQPEDKPVSFSLLQKVFLKLFR